MWAQHWGGVAESLKDTFQGGVRSLGSKICGGITGGEQVFLENFWHAYFRWVGVEGATVSLGSLLFSSSPGVCKDYSVTIRPTEASERCRLRGSYTLRTGVSALELWGGPEPGTQLYDWPYRFLRRFGRDKVSEGLNGAG